MSLVTSTTCFYSLHLLQLKVIVRLTCHLDRIKDPAARALIIWIIGEYSSVGQIIPKVVPSILKYLAWCFTSEEVETKLQILNTSAKVNFEISVFVVLVLHLSGLFVPVIFRI